MDVATEQNFDRVYPHAARDRFWGLVERSLTDVFNVSADAAEKYRRLVENRPVGERMLVYHQEPLNVAADLAGVAEVTEDHLHIYRDLIGSDEPTTRGLPDSP
jgi:hypothetical protein